ncbi:MAG TPA: tryptophan--tRNA ligase [Candidatus Thermoplasmatota archaeon]|nr:tryptophan--tRNA ligase [Candidatus Thermoplasmatota archaeon]
MRIDPWASTQSTDYQRLRDEFGIQAFDPDVLAEPSPLMERGVIFGHRGFDVVARAIRMGDPWGVMTGLMPSGPMHFGHKLVLDQVMYYQQLGADVTITVADIEAWATRNMSLEKAREIALENYIPNYLALGLEVKNAHAYFQSRRTAVKDLAWKLGRRVNWSTMQSIYGFGGETNMSHTMAPLVQVGDILHPQLPQHGGPRPIVVPVGVDQDPHVRLTRDLAAANRIYNVQPHKDDKLGDVLGVFVKTDEKVEGWLNAAKAALEKLGVADITLNVPYKALYISGGGAGDIPAVDAALAAVEMKKGQFGFLAPASTYHRFMGGLQGGKMSSSKPESHISLNDTPEGAEKKMASALTGGRETAEEQRRLGGRAEECMVYETYVYHLVPDQKELASLYERCKSGAMLCGECKGIAKSKVNAFMKNVKDKRDEKLHLVKELVRED